MAHFRYTAFSTEGVREDGSLQAASEGQAWDKLSSLNLTVVELTPDTGVAKSVSPGWLSKGNVSLAAQAELAEQLSVLFRARLSAMQIVEVIAKGTTLPALRRKFQRIGQLMADGATFPDAFADAGRDLNPLFVSLARIGQETGDPSALMKSLAATLRRQQKITSQITSALVYPIILVLGGLGILALMSLYLAPRLATIFSSVEKDVPAALSVFIAAGEMLRNWWLVLLVLTLAVLLTVPSFYRRQRSRVSALIQHLPVLGPIARDASLSRLSRSVQIMLAAGMPLTPTLRSTAGAFPFDPLAMHFEAAASNIEAGGTGHHTFSEVRDLPTIFRELFAIGERTNTLPTVMESVATALEDQVERRVQRAMLLMTPVLTLVIGGGIALLVYAVMSALLSVNDLAF
jgi:general secretion pathway protein F